MHWRLFERTRPQRPNLGFGGEPVLGLMSGREAASFGTQVSGLGDQRASCLGCQLQTRRPLGE